MRFVEDDPPAWWHVAQRFERWVIKRRQPGCRHPAPTHGDERLHYGFRCSFCFLPIKPAP